jgi:hypothetical protein
LTSHTALFSARQGQARPHLAGIQEIDGARGLAALGSDRNCRGRIDQTQWLTRAAAPQDAIVELEGQFAAQRALHMRLEERHVVEQLIDAVAEPDQFLRLHADAPEAREFGGNRRPFRQPVGQQPAPARTIGAGALVHGR